MIDNNVTVWMMSEMACNSNLKVLSDKNDCVTIRATLMDCAELNRNRSEYPKPVIQAGLEHEMVASQIRMRSWVGEAGHPINPTMERQMAIDHSNVSHRVLECDWYRGSDRLDGIVKTAPTPRGRDMANFIRDDDAMITAFSLRSISPIQKFPDRIKVLGPIKMKAFDWVFYQSYPSAYQREILSTGKKVAGRGNSMQLSESTRICIEALNGNPNADVILNEATKYAMDQSKTFRMMFSMFENENTDVMLNESGNGFIIKNTFDNGSNDKFYVPIEKAIATDINAELLRWR